MSDDDFRTQIALLSQKLEQINTRLEKVERGVNWATLLIVGTVIANVLKQIGLS